VAIWAAQPSARSGKGVKLAPLFERIIQEIPMQSFATRFARCALLGIGAAVAAGMSTLSAAQDAAKDYPSKPIIMVVPYAAGGSSDTRARQVGQKLAQILGKPVVVDNKPGAAGNIGTDFIAKAAPDGYVIGIGNFAPLSVNKSLMPQMPFDPVKDLTPIAHARKRPDPAAGQREVAVQDAEGLIADAKAKPDKLSYASAGQGGAYHLAGEQFKDITGHADHPHPVQGRRPGRDRPARRPGRHDVRLDHRRHSAPDREAAADPGAGDHQRQALAAAAECSRRSKSWASRAW
jgi:hypothetical protein